MEEVDEPPQEEEEEVEYEEEEEEDESESENIQTETQEKDALVKEDNVGKFSRYINFHHIVRKRNVQSKEPLEEVK